MVISDNEEIIRVRSRIEELLTKDRELKAEIKENNRNIEIAEEYLASLLGTTVSEISSVKSIGDHLEEALRKEESTDESPRIVTGDTHHSRVRRYGAANGNYKFDSQLE